MNMIKNYDAVLDELVSLLMQFDKDCNGYQTDVYAYYDQETQTVTLDTFCNPGGCNWLDDDHFTIHHDREHNETFWDWYQEIPDIADALGISVTQLRAETIRYDDVDEEDVDIYDIKRYLSSRPDYVDKLQDAYNDCIDGFGFDYVEKAHDILYDLECTLFCHGCEHYDGLTCTNFGASCPRRSDADYVDDTLIF